MNVRYRVELSQAKRAELTTLLRGKHAARKLKRAQILVVDGATPSTAAAFRIVIDSPSAGADDGRKRGIFQCRRKLPTLLASKR